MPFSKSFPKTSKTSPYPQWEEIFLTDAEEKAEEQKCRNENIKLMKMRSLKTSFYILFSARISSKKEESMLKERILLMG
ncbi:hypothetical protein J4458_03340 [Candidatus Woesearchaeota archaeon]|nr:hypothetical protein [Candidatus Woesearchaeota archaeon]